MVRISSSSLLALLPVIARAAPVAAPSWEIDGLSAVDAPVDPTQTGTLPATHRLFFNITDLQQDLKYSCSVSWENDGIPPDFQYCSPAPGNTDTTIGFDVFSYDSASTSFTIGITEDRVVDGVNNFFTGSFTETPLINGGHCNQTPLENNPSVSFSSCSWFPFFVSSTQN